nr:hypothetical protein [Tanacetum cinerariifolium]
MPKVLLLAWYRVFEIKDSFGNKQYEQEDIQELFRKFFNDVQNIHEEFAEYINTPSWIRPAFYNNGEDDDEDYTIAITPDFRITDSLNLDSTLKNDRFDTESYLLESLLNRDTLMASSSKIDSLLDEFAGIDSDYSDSEGDNLFLERLLHDDHIPLPDTLDFSNIAQDSVNKNKRFSGVTPTDPVDSLSMGDEHLNTIPTTESDEFIKSCVENLVPNPNSDSSDDQSLSVEDVREKIYSNPLFDEEIIPMEIDQHSFNAESDLIESLPNHDSSSIIYSKIDSLFDEFAEIRLTKRLLYDNSSPRPLEEIVTDISYADIESFSPSPIPNKDSDPLMEEIDLFFNPNDPMPSGIEEDDYDFERDILILDELLDNYSLSLPTTESYHFDIPSPYRPP